MTYQNAHRWAVKLVTLFTLIFIANPIAAQTAGGANTDASIIPTVREQAVIDKVEAYMNSIRTLEADFVQVTNQQEESRGRFYLDRPGKMRIEYDPPSQVLMVATGKYLTYVDRQVEQVEHIAVEETPAAFFLQNNIQFNPEAVVIKRVVDSETVVALSVASRQDPFGGTLTLVFAKNPMVLRWWQVVDGQGIATKFSLQNPKTGHPLSEKLFDVDISNQDLFGN